MRSRARLLAFTIVVALFTTQVQAKGDASRLSSETKRAAKASATKTQLPQPTQQQAQSSAATTSGTTPASAVSPSRGRRVVDVVAQAKASRNGTAAALDPKLLELADDSTAYVDERGEIFFVEDAPGPETLMGAEAQGPAVDPTALEGAAFPSGSVFELNSRPGSTKTIYIDFDGETVANTYWNTPPYYSVTMPPFSRDTDPAFSATELAVIRDVWLGVAEDFAPFDVNVTTQRPGPDAFFKSSQSDPTYGVMAVVTTGDKSWLCATCGGIAFLDVFSDGPFFGPAWALPSSNTSTRYIATTVSHEVGHNLSLMHDGGTANPNYYSGHGNWGPIMGASSRQYTQWSKGEYSGANNSEDDTAIIGAQTGFVSDENNSFGNATLLPAAGAYTADQTIGFVGDTDYYAIDVNQGFVRVDLQASVVDPDLSPIARLYNPSGAQIAATQVVNSSTLRIEQSQLPPGRYFVGVTGGSYLTPTDGFSTYGSLGYFRLAARIIPPPVAPTSITITATGDRALTATWVNSPQSAYTYSVTLCNIATGICTDPVVTGGTSAPFSGLFAPANLFTRITVTNQLGELTRSQGYSTDVLAKPLSPTVRRLRFKDDLDQVTVEWDSGASYSPISVAATDIYFRNPTIGTWTLAGTVSGDSGSAVLAVPPAWNQIDVDVKMVSRTLFASPWNVSDDSNVGSFRIGQVPVPQTPSTPAAPRGPAPQAPGVVTAPRGPAPQA